MLNVKTTSGNDLSTMCEGGNFYCKVCKLYLYKSGDDSYENLINYCCDYKTCKLMIYKNYYTVYCYVCYSKLLKNPSQH